MIPNGSNFNFNNYIDNDNILIAHAKVNQFYTEGLKGTGCITLKFAKEIAVPLDPTYYSDVQAALRH